MRPIAFFIQIRMGSSRFPGKVLKQISPDLKVVELLFERIQKSKYFTPETACFLTTHQVSDDPLVDFFKRKGWRYLRGDENNVAQRFHQACHQIHSEFFFRICADNPFLEPLFMDELADLALKKPESDYLSYADPSGCPVIKTHYGFFSELIRTESFQKIQEDISDPVDMEHVTPYFYNPANRFQISLLPIPKNLIHEKIRLTVDTPEDLRIIQQIFEHLKPDFNIFDIYEYLKKDTDLLCLMEEQIKKSPK